MFEKATYLSLLFKFVLSARSRNSLWGSAALLFLEFLNVVFILFHSFTEFIMFLHTYLVTSFVCYKEYMIYLILFIKFSDVLPAFTCASAIANIWSICLGVNIPSL